jgi:hypothetical protein
MAVAAAAPQITEDWELVDGGIEGWLSKMGVGNAPKAETTGVRVGMAVSASRCEVSGIRDVR